MNEKIEKYIREQMRDLVSDLEELLDHVRDEDYSREEIAEELEGIIDEVL